MFQKIVRNVPCFKNGREKVAMTEEEGEQISFTFEKDDKTNISTKDYSDKTLANIMLSDFKIMMCAKAMTYFHELHRESNSASCFFKRRIQNKITNRYLKFISQVIICESVEEVKQLPDYNEVINTAESQHAWVIF